MASYEQQDLEHCPGDSIIDLRLAIAANGATVRNESSIQLHHRRGVLYGGRVSDTTLKSVVRPPGPGVWLR